MHHAALSYQEIVGFMSKLRAHDDDHGIRALDLCRCARRRSCKLVGTRSSLPGSYGWSGGAHEGGARNTVRCRMWGWRPWRSKRRSGATRLSSPPGAAPGHVGWHTLGQRSNGSGAMIDGAPLAFDLRRLVRRTHQLSQRGRRNGIGAHGRRQGGSGVPAG